MKLLKPGTKRLLFANQEGAMMVLSLIIMSAIVGLVLVTVTLTSITTLDTGVIRVEGQRTNVHLSGCLQEGLISLNRENDWTGGAISLSSGDCTITVTGAGSTRTLTVSASQGGYQQELIADVTLSPFSLDSISY